MINKKTSRKHTGNPKRDLKIKFKNELKREENIAYQRKMGNINCQQSNIKC